MPRRKVLVRTENEGFGRKIEGFLRRKGARVRVTRSLNDVGNALVRGGNPLHNLNKSFPEVAIDGIAIPFLGHTLYEYLRDRIANDPKYDFVVFDPRASIQDIDHRFLDADMRALDDIRCQVDGTHFSGELGWERNYLGYWHFVLGSDLAELPDEYTRGLAFMQELKAVRKGQNGGLHPNFPFVLASDDPGMRRYARLMQSLGYVDYSNGEIKFEHVDLLEELNPEDRETLEVVSDYLSSGARVAIATSALTVLQSAVCIPRIIVPSVAYAQTQSANAQPPREIKITANHVPNKTNNYTCVGYWIGNPRVRLCVSDLSDPFDDISFGMFLPPSKGDLKIVASRNDGNEEAGIYVHRSISDGILLGVSGEYLDGEFSGESHLRLDVPFLDRVFVGYGNRDGNQTVTIGDFLDLGKYHFALIFSEAEREGGTYRPQLRAYISRDGIVKLFYTGDGKTKSLGGFIRVGKEFRPYTPKGFDGDRIDFAQGPNIQSSAWAFHIPLFPQNTHLSDQGVVAIEPRVLLTPDGSRIGLRGFYTHDGRLVGGYGITRIEANGTARYEHTLSAGANIGPVKIVGSYEIGKGPGVYVMLRHKVE